ncbi:hypothetical protein Y032_0007g3170 [Ancylostoma ceylanicum]|nr:hypothetical protein Y032_0007g3170 [Ancylostoma ceylanicum]
MFGDEAIDTHRFCDRFKQTASTMACTNKRRTLEQNIVPTEIEIEQPEIMRSIFVVLALAFSAVCSQAQGMPGGIMIQDPNNPEYMIKAWKAAKKVESNGDYLMIPLKVMKAQSQVVAGMKYILEVIYGESYCRKSGSITPAIMATHCRKKHGGSRALYSVVIWEKPWQNFEEYTVTKIRDIAVGK